VSQPQAERRRNNRGTPQGEPSRAALVGPVLGSYAEMPGLSLDIKDAARLFGLRETTCRVVFADLLKSGRLRLSADGRYRAA
jgi:hypothetical protein